MARESTVRAAARRDYIPCSSTYQAIPKPRERVAEFRDLTVESYGSATWKKRMLARGVEPDACYYTISAGRIIGKHHRIDLESDPPPDIVVEIDIDLENDFSLQEDALTL